MTSRLGEHFPLQPGDILRRHAAAEDHRADDRPAPVDRESHHTHLHSLRSGDSVDGSGCGETLRLNIFPQVNPARNVMKSVLAQLSFSKGAWFHEDESRVNELIKEVLTPLSLDLHAALI